MREYYNRQTISIKSRAVVAILQLIINDIFKTHKTMTTFVDNLSVKKFFNTVTIYVISSRRRTIMTIERSFVKDQQEIKKQVEALLRSVNSLEACGAHIDVYFNEGINSAEFWCRVQLTEDKVIWGPNQHFVSDLIYFAEIAEKHRLEAENNELEYDDECGQERAEYEYAYGFDE